MGFFRWRKHAFVFSLLTILCFFNYLFFSITVDIQYYLCQFQAYSIMVTHLHNLCSDPPVTLFIIMRFYQNELEAIRNSILGLWFASWYSNKPSKKKKEAKNTGIKIRPQATPNTITRNNIFKRSCSPML